jgi:hypothetical protein
MTNMMVLMHCAAVPALHTALLCSLIDKSTDALMYCPDFVAEEELLVEVEAWAVGQLIRWVSKQAIGAIACHLAGHSPHLHVKEVKPAGSLCALSLDLLASSSSLLLFCKSFSLGRLPNHHVPWLHLKLLVSACLLTSVHITHFAPCRSLSLEALLILCCT